MCSGRRVKHLLFTSRIRALLTTLRRYRCLSAGQKDRPKEKSSAQDLLLNSVRAPGYSQRAAEFLVLARGAPLPAVRGRYLTIAEHSCELADVERRVAMKKSPTPQPMLQKPDVAEEKENRCAE